MCVNVYTYTIFTKPLAIVNVIYLLECVMCTAMEITEKNVTAILFWGQIRRHYDGKNFRQKFVISVSVSTMQRRIMNKISKNKH